MRGTRIWLVAIAALLLGALAPAGSADAVETKPEWGSVSAKNGVLKRGCRDYTYRYEVTAPDDGWWDLSVTVVGPGGKALWFGYLYDGANPPAGTATYHLCRSRTRPGRFKLKALVSVQDNDKNVEGRLPTARYRLR